MPTVMHEMYFLLYDTETELLTLDEEYEQDEGACVLIDPEDDNFGYIEVVANNGRPKGTKVPMKKRTREIEQQHNFPTHKMEVSKVTVVKTVKKNDEEKDDLWDYDYQFTFEMFTNMPMKEGFVLTLKHNQNGKEHQFNIEDLRGKKDIEITLINQDTALFDITKSVIGGNFFDVTIGDNYFSFKDVPTDFTVDLSNLNLIQKGRYGIQRIKVKD